MTPNILSPGLRHQFPDHELPHRGDVPAQAHRLRHPLHGGDRQGDLRDEALRQFKGEDLRRRVPETGKLFSFFWFKSVS